MNPASALDMWFIHSVELAGEERRTAGGVTYGPPVKVMASVNAQSRVVTDQLGQEVTVAATVTWAADGPLPAIGSKITLPPMFGMKPDRAVVTARRAVSGTGLTPDHVEVTLR